jgi:hypothetical protein
MLRAPLTAPTVADLPAWQAGYQRFSPLLHFFFAVRVQFAAAEVQQAGKAEVGCYHSASV